MNPNRYVRIVSRLATSLAVIGASLVANAQTIPPNGQGLPAGAVFNPETRTFTWTPTAAQVGQHQVTFWVTDGIDTDSETITITVSNLNGNADMNGDSHADLILQSQSTLNATYQGLNGNGSPVGQPGTIVSGSSKVQLLAIADMNNDSVTDFIVRRLDGSNTHEIRFRDATGKAVGYKTYTPSGADWRIVGAYDQDRDGITDLVWHDINKGSVLVAHLNAQGTQARYTTIVNSMADWRVVAVGDLNIDGLMDILWQNVSGGKTSLVVWYLNQNGSRSSNKTLASIAEQWRCVGLADYSNDGVLDLVWQNVETYGIVAWKLNINGVSQGNLTLGNGQDGQLYANWQWNLSSKAMPSDENADGNADVLWQNQDGALVSWRYDGAWNRLESVTLSTAARATGKLVALADMDNDGINDLVWSRENSGTREAIVWLMNGDTSRKRAYIVRNTVPLVWELVGAGDMNADGYPDLVWQNMTNGGVVTWHLDGNGARISTATVVSSMQTYRVQVLADMNGDGIDDIIWQGTSGPGKSTTIIWYMNGSGTRTGTRTLTELPEEWTLTGAADYDGNGTTDVIWFNTSTKSAVAWMLNSSNVRISNVTIASGMGTWRPAHW